MKKVSNSTNYIKLLEITSDKNDIKFDPRLNIIIDNYSTIELNSKNIPCLSADCIDQREIEYWIKRLEEELKIIKKEAREFFNEKMEVKNEKKEG